MAKSTLKVELRNPVGIHSTPVFFVRVDAIVTFAGWLPEFVESLEVEGVDSPLSDAANGAAVVGLGVGSPSNGGAVAAATISGPASLTVPEIKLFAASTVLNMLEGLHNIVKVLVGSVSDGLTLPVAEGVDKAVFEVSFH